MTWFPIAELTERTRRFQEHLEQHELDGALIHGITNLLYFAGTAQQGHLWIPVTGDPALLVRRVVDRARKESALAEIRELKSLRDLPRFVGGAGRIGMELDILPVSLFARYQKVLGTMEIEDVGWLSRVVRSRKSDLEVERIRQAAEAANKVFQEVLRAVAPGMTELDLSVVAEASSRRHGFQGILRWRATTGFECPWVHVLAGPSALDFSSADTPYGGPGVTPAVPYGAGHRVIEPGMPLCFDQAFVRDGYIHDMTRTFSVGPVAEDLSAGHDLCVAMHRELEAKALPGVSGEEVWDICLSMVSEAGLADQFMGLGPSRAGFVGHGVGLELDELPVMAPRQTATLEAGQVIALEPKLFYPEVGSVGLENTYLVRAEGLEKITTTADKLFVV